MKNNKLIDTLQDLGLSSNEAAVYCSSLSLGPATIAKIAKASGLKRTTVYSVVDSLENRGLMNQEITGWKKLFAAGSPEKLERILESRREKLRNVLPEFSALYNMKGEESFIKYYQGVEAVKNVYNGMIRDVRPHEDYNIISDCRRWYDVDREFFEEFYKRRAKLPINVRLLVVKNELGCVWKSREQELNFKVRFLPEGTTLTTNLVFIPKRILIQQLTDPIFAMTIESSSAVQMFREMFEIMWRSVEPPQV